MPFIYYMYMRASLSLYIYIYAICMHSVICYSQQSNFQVSQVFSRTISHYGIYFRLLFRLPIHLNFLGVEQFSHCIYLYIVVIIHGNCTHILFRIDMICPIEIHRISNHWNHRIH